MAVPSIEKYVIMRMRAYALRHRKDLAEWMSRPQAVEQGYWDSFNASRKRSEEWFEAEAEKINGDPNMNYRDRAEEIVKLADRRLYSAWSGVGFGIDCGEPKPACQHAECAFLRTYVGDTTVSEAAFTGNLSAVGAELQKLRGPEWDTIRNNQPIRVPMSAWDLTLFAALTDPQDGSVPVPPLGASVVPPPTSQAPAPAPNSPADLVGISPDDPRAAVLADVFARTCEFCGDVRKTPLGKTRHARLCPENPDRAPVPVMKKKAAEDATAPSEEPVEAGVEAD